MDETQELLFGRFPRLVGTPEQFPVFDEGSFDVFVDRASGKANCYSRISWLARTGEWMCDRIFFDLDGHLSEEGITDVELVSKLRTESVFREDVLGEVCEDARKIASLCQEVGFPVIGVYTGKGIHLHIFTEERKFPKRELRSNQKWIDDECSLSTSDRQVYGDVKRLCRVPNCRRYDERVSTATDLFCVPLSRVELEEITPEELVNWSLEPRVVREPAESRPPLFAREEYVRSSSSADDTTFQAGSVELAESTQSILTEQLEQWLKDVLNLPCMYEAIMTRNPPHKVRFNVAIMLFNVGMTPEDVVEVYSRLGWHDFDASITRKFATQIYEAGYADMSCASIQEQGLCVFKKGERSNECEAFGYPGGNQDWDV